MDHALRDLAVVYQQAQTVAVLLALALIMINGIVSILAAGKGLNKSRNRTALLLFSDGLFKDFGLQVLLSVHF